MSNTDINPRGRSTPTPAGDNGPVVQVPLGRERAGLTIDGEFSPLYELPPAAAEAYTKYATQGGNIRIWQCDRCGYLTDADALRVTSYDTYVCGGCGASTGSSQRRATGTFIQVHGPTVGPDDERFVDVLALVPEDRCETEHGHTVADDPAPGRQVTSLADINETARVCSACVPNHASHLGRLQNQVEGSITMTEMLDRVAAVVTAFQEA